jgi:hypothetical protein
MILSRAGDLAWIGMYVIYRVRNYLWAWHDLPENPRNTTPSKIRKM